MNLDPQFVAESDASIGRMLALLLVGGLGTRLRSAVPSKPKPLAPIGQGPFLELLVLQLRSQGIRRLVMCTGHMAGQIREYFGDGRKWDVSIEYSEETRPLGTGGAVKLAAPFLGGGSDFLVLNGDSFVEIDFGRFVEFHRGHGGIVSIATRRVPDSSRYGTVRVDASNQVVSFLEKTGVQTPGLVNAGAYLFRRNVLDFIPDGPTSLEKDVFPGLLERRVFAAEQSGMFIDIGTPEDYAQAQALSRAFRQLALRGCEAQNC